MSQYIKGDDVLLRKLNALGKVAGGRAMTAAVRTALKPVMDDARSNVPQGDEAHKTYKGRLVGPGFASRNLTMLVRINRSTGNVEGRLGVKSEAYYALQFVELGVPAYGIVAHPWLEPAFRRGQKRIIQDIRSALKDQIEKIARRKK